MKTKKINDWALLIVVSLSFVLFTNVQQLSASHSDPVCKTQSISSSDSFWLLKKLLKSQGVPQDAIDTFDDVGAITTFLFSLGNPVAGLAIGL
ncbi:MAG: hypothetical protein ACOXZJ_06430 [Bacteroidales bacterium]|jgi:hypothetical protein|nr:hypothetical protein [Acholeplasmataceae bacterium]